jgi:hypothetical protein
MTAERALTRLAHGRDLLAEHPWPRGVGDGRALEWRWTVELPCDRDTAWGLIADV